MKQDSPSAKPLPLDAHMSGGWRALEEVNVSGWVCRFSSGVTRRANSVLPVAVPADVGAAIAHVEELCAVRGLPTVFQISPDSLPHNLDGLLAERGYAHDSPTIVQLAGPERLGLHASTPPDGRVVLSEKPSREWLEVFWGTEGPHDPAGQDASLRILQNTPSVYASLMAGERVESVARMALVGKLGGVYCVVTRPDSRSRGHARSVVASLLAEAARRDLEGVWLQVGESNDTALRLYASLGFETVSRYHYRRQST